MGRCKELSEENDRLKRRIAAYVYNEQCFHHILKTYQDLYNRAAEGYEKAVAKNNMLKKILEDNHIIVIDLEDENG